MKQVFFKEMSKPFIKNKVIIAHIGQVLDIAPIDEGEAFVLKILKDGNLALLGAIKPEEWVLATPKPQILGLSQKNIINL